MNGQTAPRPLGSRLKAAATASKTRGACVARGDTRAGIRPFCITVDREARDYLPHLYGAAHYTVVDEVARLPYKIADIYRRLTH